MVIKRSYRGFTHVELLVVLLILSLLLVAAPIAFDRVDPGLEVRRDAREMAPICREACSLAIRENCETVVAIDVSERRVGLTGEEPQLIISERVTVNLEATAYCL